MFASFVVLVDFLGKEASRTLQEIYILRTTLLPKNINLLSQEH